MDLSPALDVHPAVAAALSEGRPVVALESTIITHGMPYPANIETAIAVETIVREHGAVPATIAVLDGKLKVGLTHEELERLAHALDAVKCSRRDLPVVIARRGVGATTVAGTMIVAAMAGIRVFVTGGIGGVHRGAETTMDVSADLQELARTDVAVVCAGAKAILDLGLTLEYLETHGVPVLGYRTDRFPAFYVRDGGHGVDTRVDDLEELADILATKWRLGLSGGAVVANPIPADHELDAAAIEAAICDAVDEARAKHVSGKALTPFLLSRLGEVTAGRSLVANIALVKHNAAVGAGLAKAMAARA
jgi:pseudouridine-5'-phosphate glycosidase